MKKAIFIICGVLTGFSVTWGIYNYFTYWDELLTPKQWWGVNWKPMIILTVALIGYQGFIYDWYDKKEG